MTCVNSHFYSSFPFHWQYQHCPQWHPPTVVRKRVSRETELHTHIFVMYERELIISNRLTQLWRLESPHSVLSASRKDGGVIQFKSRVLRTRGCWGQEEIHVSAQVIRQEGAHFSFFLFDLFRPSMGFPGGSDGKESSCNAGDLSSIPGSGRSPGGGHGNPLQYSCLENPTDRGAWRATYNPWGLKELDTTEWTQHAAPS